MKSLRTNYYLKIFIFSFTSTLIYWFSSICRAFEYELERLSSNECYFTSLSNQLRKKRDYLAKVLKNAGLEPIIPDGGYFIMADWSKFGKSISSKLRILLNFESIFKIKFRLEKLEWWKTFKENRIDLSSETDQEKDLRFAKWLSKTRKLQGIPPSVFFSKDHKHIGEPFIRFCFIKVSFIKIKIRCI